MANYIDIVPVIEKNISKFVGKILHEEDLMAAASFVGFIHKYEKESGDHLLERFKRKYIEAKEPLGFCYYYFGKNEKERGQVLECKRYLDDALKIFKDIRHEKGMAYVQAELVSLLENEEI